MTITCELEHHFFTNNEDVMTQELLEDNAINYSVEIAEIMISVDRLKAEFAEVGKLEAYQVKASLEQLQKLASGVENLQQEVQEQFANWRQGLREIGCRMNQATDLEELLQITTVEVGEKIKCDRVLIYRFNCSESGVVLAESQTNGWIPTLGKNLLAVSFGLSSTREYLVQQIAVIDDIYRAEVTPHQRHLLEGLQVKSNLSLAIVVEGKIWGLLVVQICNEARQWQESEISFLYQITMQLSQRLQGWEYQKQLQQQQVQQTCLDKVIRQIRASADLTEIFPSTIQDVRHLLQCDRVAIYRFHPNESGEVIAESAGSRWQCLLKEGNSTTVWEEILWQATKGSRYAIGETLVVDDICQVNYACCHLNPGEQLAVKAYMIVPVFSGNKLWGLLAAYQNSEVRNWQPWEINAMTQMAVVLGIAVQQANYSQQLQVQLQQLTAATEREKTNQEILQQTVLQLIASVRLALKGELTVTAAITDNELGTIAKVYHNTLQSVQQMVLQVQYLTQQVAATSSASDDYLTELTNLAQQQFDDISSALVQVQLMTSAAQAVVGNAELVEAAVLQANRTLQGSDAAMNQTVEGIEAIRDTVCQNSKKIKRLSKSCLKISRVVTLMENCATQTNFLGLSAAMEAARAGEHGKGFGVVAEEVRSLGRNFTTAAKEIEELVQEIQEETQAVSISIQTSRQQVVECSNLVNQTRQDFHRILATTAQISQWVEGITHATVTQTQQALSVTSTLQEVSQVAYQTSAQAAQISSSYLDLLSLAQELLDEEVLSAES
jgi:methyl-accepting chemotaxis protein PixJ